MEEARLPGPGPRSARRRPVEKTGGDVGITRSNRICTVSFVFELQEALELGGLDPRNKSPNSDMRD